MEIAFPGFKHQLSGEGLARCLEYRPARFQPLPLGTAREVFPQAARPVSFTPRVMGQVSLAVTFTGIPQRWGGGGVSTPRTTPGRHRGTRYSTATSPCPACSAAFYA